MQIRRAHALPPALVAMCLGSGCPRVVLPSQPEPEPAISISSVALASARPDLRCPGDDGAQTGLPQDEVVVQGTGWDVEGVSVVAGFTALSLSAPPTTTELRALLPASLAASAITVTSPGRKAATSDARVCVAQPQVITVEIDPARTGLACPGDPDALPAISGDVLVVTGTGFRPEQARIRVGTVELPVPERPDGGASLRVVLPPVLPTGPVVVAADGVESAPGTRVCVVPPVITSVAVDPPRTGVVCPGDPAALPAFAGDTLVVDGTGFREELARVRVGDVMLPVPQRTDGGTGLRMVLPSVVPTGPVVLSADGVETAPGMAVCVVGPGHAPAPQFSGVLETQLSIGAAGTGAAVSPQCLQFDDQRDGGTLPPGCLGGPVQSVAVSFNLGALPSYTRATYATQLQLDGVNPLLQLDAMEADAGVRFVQTVRPTARANQLPAVMESTGQPQGEDSAFISRLHHGDTVVAEGSGLLPLALTGPYGLFATIDNGWYRGSFDHVVRAHAEGLPDASVTLPGSVLAAGMLEAPWQGGDATNAALVELACLGVSDAGLPSLAVNRLTIPDGTIHVETGRLQVPLPCPAGAPCEDLAHLPCDGGPHCIEARIACDGGTGCEGGKETVQALLTQCGQVQLQCAQEPGPTGCQATSTRALACLATPQCATLLNCVLTGQCGGVDPGLGTPAEQCEQMAGCRGALDCWEAGDGGFHYESTCAISTFCGVLCGTDEACQSALECARDPEGRCPMQATGELLRDSPFTVGAALKCARQACLGPAMQEVVPMEPGVAALVPRGFQAPLSDEGTPLCAVDLESNIMVGTALEADVRAATVVPAGVGGIPVFLGLLAGAGNERTMLISSGLGTYRVPTRITYQSLLTDPSGQLVYGIPEHGASVDVLDARGQLVGTLGVLGPVVDAIPLPADDGRTLVLHEHVALLVDPAGAVQASALLPESANGDVVQLGPEGLPERTWRSVVTQTSVFLQTVDVQADSPSFGQVEDRAELSRLGAPLLVAGDQLILAVSDDGEHYSLSSVSVTEAELPGMLTPVSIPGSENLWPVAWSAVGNRVFVLEGYASGAAGPLRIIDLSGETPTVLPDAWPTTFYLQGFPDGTMIGYFFNEPIYEFQFAVIEPDNSYSVLTLDSPVPPSPIATSPDGRRLYLGAPGSLVEMEVARDAEGAMQLEVRSRIEISGTPSLLRTDAHGTRVVAVDQSAGVVGALE